MRAVLEAVDPILILTNHSLTQGHGHHRASYWAITEVLKERAAAGAPVPCLYSRCGVEDAQWNVDPAELEPARGETYARLAHRAWTQHVTQGPWGPHNPLQVGKDWWKLANAELVPDAPKGDPRAIVEPREMVLNARLAPAALAREVRERLTQMTRGEGGPSTSAPVIRQRIAALHRVLLVLANVRAEVWLERDEVPLGGSGKVFVVIHGVDKVKDLVVRCGGVAAEPAKTVVRATAFDGTAATPANTSAETPAAGATPVKAPPPPPVPGRFTAKFTPAPGPGDTVPVGPEPAFVEVEISFTLDGLPITLHPRLHYTPVEPVVVQWDREVVMVPKGQTCDRLLSASVASNGDGELAMPIRLSMGPGIRAVPTPTRLSLSPEHSDARLLVRATIDAGELAADAGIELGFGTHAARLRVVAVDVSVPPGLRVGLVRGPDDTIERALADLGITFTALDRDALMTAKLEDFTTVLLDIRAYHHRPELAEVRDRLLQFCRAGGRVVAMYHKPGEWNERAGHPLLAPFPMTIGNDRITEEDSPAKMLLPEHPLWHHPHAITAADFAGWVQERGLNFPSKWDPAWATLLELKDSGDEKPHLGALLHTQYGRGDFVFCSLALYRQLRVGNPGACRLLVNLLAK